MISSIFIYLLFVSVFLQWDGKIQPFYRGLLIKVMFRCTYRGITDDRCVMLKAQGTHVCKYFCS